MKQVLISAFLVVFYMSCCAQQGNGKIPYAIKNSDSKTMKLVNGNWFNGTAFEKKIVWVEDGLFRFEKIEKAIDTIIDLSNAYVIPPFAEAHNHNLESSYEIDKRIASYLDNGVFYVKQLSSIKKRIAPLMQYYNKPTGVDVSMAHAPLTAFGGHPMGIRKLYLDRGYFDGLFNSLAELEFHGYVTIGSEEDLERKWDSILSFSPDFIKINLLYSEEYGDRKDDSRFFGKKGLNPKLVPKIVDKAHRAGLRVSAHVETAHDFHVAVNAGVDEIAHLPEIKNGKPIHQADVVMAKEKGIVVVTTISLVTKRQKSPNYDALLRNIKSNLQLLKEGGVTLAIGSDMYNDNSVNEFKLVHDMQVFSTIELLKMWTENATKTTFPYRKVAKLEEDYEASFLVLDKNPLEDLSAINKSIVLKVKQGVILR